MRTTGTRLPVKGRKMMDLAEVRLHGPHGSFQKSESRKWPNTIFTASCVLLEAHYTGSVTRCEARCVSLRQSASFVSASERHPGVSVRQSASFISASGRHLCLCVRAPVLPFVSASERQFCQCVTAPVCRLVPSGSRVALPPPIPTRTPSGAPPCVVPLSIPPLVVSGVALWLWLPLVAFVPLLREWFLCSLPVHLQPFVNVVG